MEAKDQMRHRRVDVPAYLVWVHTKPSSRGKSKQAYCAAIQESARREIASPILADDIEIEVLYSTSASKGVRLDIDNVLKPTLDALKCIAYSDDNQVRSVTATLFDKTMPGTLAGMVEHLQGLFYSGEPHVVLISVYSDSRLRELGGAKFIAEQRMKAHLATFHGNARIKKIERL